jgi:lipopolysaccharide export system ATP-binding protein
MVYKDKRQQMHKLEELLGELSIDHLMDAYANILSGGERRRVEIARCLSANPSYILLDEPFSGIDPIAVGEIKEIILRLKEKDIGILISDHNVRETLSMIDTAYIIHNGLVLCHGDSKSITNDARVKKVYLGDTYSS